MRFASIAVLAIVAIAIRLDAPAAQPSQPAGAGATTIEEITVIGRYPGPPLWKVTSGERTLWIFGDLTPVPKGLDWDPRNAQRVLDRADGVISAPRVSAPTFNPFRIFRLLRDVRRLTRLADGTTLADVLPPDLNARYAVLHARYQRNDKRGDDLRPALAVLRLYGAALGDVGLTMDSNVGSKLKRLMRRSQAEESAPKIKTEPEVVVEALGKITREAELACFATVLTSIETDLEGMKERANAWASGDVAALRRFDYPDSQGNCLAMLFSSSGVANLRDELYAMWLAEAERALATRQTTFSVLPMRELIAADGLLAQLAARGYTVTAP
jgi:hypothetical protein